MFGGETDEATKYIAPTLVRDVPSDDSLMSEYVYTEFSTSIRLANLSICLKGDLWACPTNRPSGGRG